MIKRVLAIALVAALSLNVKVGTVVAMDTTDGYKVWESYEEYAPTDQRYEEETGEVMKEEAEEDTSFIEENNYPQLVDENNNPIDPIGQENEEPIEVTPEEEPMEEPVEQPAEEPVDSPDVNLDDYFVEDDSYNNDFSFDEAFDFNPYNPGDFNFYDPSIGSGSSNGGSYEEQEEEEPKKPGDDFLKTGKTIHYAYGGVDRYTKFIDTGIKTTESGQIGYTQMLDLFNRISIEQGWKIVEDTNKLMILKDGNIVVVKNENLNEESLQRIFKDTEVTIKIQDTRAGGKFTIADYLEAYGSLDVLINNKQVTLHAEPELVNSKALIPVRSIGEGLGAVVTWNQSKREATIVKSDTRIIYSVDSSTVDVDGDKYLLTEKTKIDDEKNRLLSVINLLVTELDAKMHWDSNDNVLIIESNEPAEKVNLDMNL